MAKKVTKPARKAAPSPEVLRQSMIDWKESSLAMLERIRRVAIDVLNESGDERSPLSAFLEYDSDLQDFVREVEEAQTSLLMVNITVIPHEIETALPNPTDLLIRK